MDTNIDPNNSASIDTKVDISPATAWIGIDIAKATFEACIVHRNGKPIWTSLPNTPEGFRKLTRWANSKAPGEVCHFCMEATGAYGEALAVFLAEGDYRISVVNPYRTKHAAMAKGTGNKTDPVDAHTVAEFCRKENPPLWRRAAPEVRLLIGLLRRLQTLKDQLAQEKNRLSEPGVIPEVQRSLKKSVRFLEKEIAGLEKQIDAHIKSHPKLKADRELLMSIPGIAELTAAWLLAELPDVNQFESAQSAAAYAGLAPFEYRSGTSVRRRTRLSKQGNARLRRILYMPALTAIRFNPAVRALHDRLIAKGRSPMVAVGAAMRKLLMIAYGVLKSQQKFSYTPSEAAA